jgi:hypothetical protein
MTFAKQGPSRKVSDQNLYANFGRIFSSKSCLFAMVVSLVSAQSFMKTEDLGNPYNVVENETFSEVDPNSSISWFDRNVSDALSRKVKFDNPPSSVQSEVNSDTIIDDWE